MMNEANTITKQTKLYGFIAEKAQRSRISFVLNKLFRQNGIDAMMLPMNIREDDLYFTVANMKKSHVNGAFIAPEYCDAVTELLDVYDDAVARSGFCDFVTVAEGKLHGTQIAPVAFAKECARSDSAALLRSSPLMGALLLTCNGKEIACYDEYIESLLALSERIGRDIDINRLESSSDLSGYAFVLDTKAYDFENYVEPFAQAIFEKVKGGRDAR